MFPLDFCLIWLKYKIVILISCLIILSKQNEQKQYNPAIMLKMNFIMKHNKQITRASASQHHFPSIRKIKRLILPHQKMLKKLMSYKIFFSSCFFIASAFQSNTLFISFVYKSTILLLLC